MALIEFVLSVSEGIVNDYKRGENPTRIVSNAIVNAAIYGFSMMFGNAVGSYAASTIGFKVGVALGSICPGVGNLIGGIVGSAVGLGVGLLIYWFISSIEFKNGTLKEQAQDFVYWIGDENFGL